MSETKPKDGWDKWQIVSTTTAALLLPVVGLLYTCQTRVADSNRLQQQATAERNRLEQQAKLERASKEADRATTLSSYFVTREPYKQRFALALVRAFERQDVLPHEIILVFEEFASDPATNTAPEIKTATDKVAVELSDRGKTPEVREAATKAVEKAIPSSGKKPNRIYMEINDDGQRQRAQEIADVLQPLGFSNYGIETEPRRSAENKTEVHYRVKEDLGNANLIANILKNQFKLSSKVVSDERNFLISHNPGHFEIHFAQD